LNVVELHNVSKKFILYHERARSFQAVWLNWFHRNRNNAYEQFWALRDINLTVAEGDTLSVIGPNGAGKSTMLKLITRILEPTEGVIVVNGRTSALIELGAGFHADLTGRDNIFLNGSILGFSRREMISKFDEIVQFAELEQFIDTELKRWSTGMVMRLGFAIATSIDPDLLITDEILAVGDESFQKKCLRRIGSLKEAGKAIIFVSHDMDAVRSLCERALWLDHGKMRALGPAEQVVEMYLQSEAASAEEALKVVLRHGGGQE
jgi:lipopolysaccharide transport system ATP-binding protein